MLYLSENLKKYRILKNLTQEEVADYLNLTPQSVSKWERGDCFPDITFLPALANIFETSIDLLVGMDTLRAEETRYNIHKKCGRTEKANALASELPHTRESREIIQPLISQGIDENEIVTTQQKICCVRSFFT